MNKKSILFCISFLFLVFTARSQSAPKIDAITIIGPCYGDTIRPNYLSFGVLISYGYDGISLAIHWGDGSSDTYSGSWGGRSFEPEHYYGTPGRYTVKLVLYDSTHEAIDSTQHIFDVFCKYLHGGIYKRNDANCVFNPGTDHYISTPAKLRLDKNNVPQDTIYAAPFFSLKIPNPDSTAEYSLHFIEALAGYVAACPASGQYKFRLDTLSASNAVFLFGLDCNTSDARFDLFAYMSAFLRFVSNSYLSLYAGNAACDAKDGTLTLQLSPKYTFSSASVAPSSVNGQTISWDLRNLDGNYSQYIDVVLNPVGNLTPDDTACNILSITPSAGDANTANNTYTSCDTIRASWDPNDKKVNPQGDITPGIELTYTINFENLGNDTAFNIYILDTLSNNLVHGSFELVYSTHPVTTIFNDVLDPKIVRFEFNDIHLPDKNSPDHNKGSIIYKIRVKEDLPAGASIENTAHIFFDINPAVVTNTTLSTIGDGTTIKAVTPVPAPYLYPNPIEDRLYIDNRSAHFDRMTIINTLGQTIYQKDIQGDINTISTTTLPPGIYYIKVNGASRTETVKIIRK